MELEQFYVGQRVKQYDKDDNCNVYGHVTKIEGQSVWILWNDLNETCEHNDIADLATIKDGNPS